MDRRSFIKSAGGVAAAGAAATTLAAPAVAQGKKEMTIVSTWPRDFQGLAFPLSVLRHVLPSYPKDGSQLSTSPPAKRLVHSTHLTKSRPATQMPTSRPTIIGRASTLDGLTSQQSHSA